MKYSKGSLIYLVLIIIFFKKKGLLITLLIRQHHRTKSHYWFYSTGWFSIFHLQVHISKAQRKHPAPHIHTRPLLKIAVILKHSLHKLCKNTGLHWPVFSRTRTESMILSLYGKIRVSKNQYSRISYAMIMNWVNNVCWKCNNKLFL